MGPLVAIYMYIRTLVFTHECKGINCKQDETSNKIPLP